MRLRALALVAAIGAMVVAALVILAQLVGTPLTPPSDTQTVPAPPPAAPTASAGPDPTGGLHWNDPSVDPAVLKKAFTPPSASLPAEALPRPSKIRPPRDEVRRMQRQRAVAY